MTVSTDVVENPDVEIVAFFVIEVGIHGLVTFHVIKFQVTECRVIFRITDYDGRDRRSLIGNQVRDADDYCLFGYAIDLAYFCFRTFWYGKLHDNLLLFTTWLSPGVEPGLAPSSAVVGVGMLVPMEYLNVKWAAYTSTLH